MDWLNRLQTVLSPAAAKELGTGTEGYVQEDKGSFFSRRKPASPTVEDLMDDMEGERHRQKIAKQVEDANTKKQQSKQALLSMSKQALSNVGADEPPPAKMVDHTPQNFDLAGTYSRFASPFRRRDERS